MQPEPLRIQTFAYDPFKQFAVWFRQYVGAVLWFGAEDKLVFAATADTRHCVNFTLDQIEKKLDPRHFIRVHRSAIVNLDQIAAFQPAFAGTYRVQLRDAARTEVPVSRSRARELRQRLGAQPERVQLRRRSPPSAPCSRRRADVLPA